LEVEVQVQDLALVVAEVFLVEDSAEVAVLEVEEVAPAGKTNQKE
jgi:hypothetical protein